MGPLCRPFAIPSLPSKKERLKRSVRVSLSTYGLMDRSDRHLNWNKDLITLTYADVSST
ncbi:hypothetical protein CHS0354_001025 [Potamilus streckersoni]|uniref:Uncharacterized protein n=1 Tax=Potamilus streckersoni TaxID=2493646 RepID=A0AAE0RUT9_9BIVA|nr:hypothetical protein CHS0354_001025 [Potamilus streckersoni]